MSDREERLGDGWPLLQLLTRPHPWHGISLGAEAPERLTAYIEIVPTDTVKYEIDKTTGYLIVDRPQKYSNICPSLYGFLPRTYCAERVAERTSEITGRSGIRGDGDPLDICVLSEKTFSHGDFLVRAIPIGGFRMIDGEEADDKILAVLVGDAAFGAWRSVSDVPRAQIERLEHYFLTYKQPPGERRSQVELTQVYDRQEAHDVIERSRADYRRHFGHLPRPAAERAR